MIRLRGPLGAATQLAGWSDPHAPVVAVLAPGVKGRRVHCCPQRARTPDSAAFPCKSPVFGGPREGTMIAIVDPGKPTP
jgi:hypothetical protein